MHVWELQKLLRVRAVYPPQTIDSDGSARKVNENEFWSSTMEVIWKKITVVF
jgi:hypothetical protein